MCKETSKEQKIIGNNFNLEKEAAGQLIESSKQKEKSKNE